MANDNWDWLGNPYAFRVMNDNDESTYVRWNNYGATIYRHDQYDTAVICTARGMYHQTYTTSDNQGSSHKAPRLAAGCP